MHTQRGFIGVGVLIAILVGLAVLGGGTYFVMQQNAQPQTPTYQDEINTLPTTQTTSNTSGQTQTAETKKPAVTTVVTYEQSVSYRMYQTDELGIKLRIPTDWTVSKIDVPRAIIIRSPDYAPSNIPQKMGYQYHEVASGAQLSIPLDRNSLNESIQDPDSYLQFRMNLAKDCSNCIATNKITIGGQSAIMNRSKYDDRGDWSGINFAHGGVEWYIGYTYNTYSAKNQEILKEFISGFEFTQKTPSAQIDAASLVNSWDTKTISGSASGVNTLSVKVAVAGYENSSDHSYIPYFNDAVPVTNGRWAIVIEKGEYACNQYSVSVYSPSKILLASGTFHGNACGD